MVFSRRCFPNERGHNLDAICKRLGLAIRSEERHRSIGDVKLTAKAFLQLRERLGEIHQYRETFTV